jgi:predicted dehydrogenase
VARDCVRSGALGEVRAVRVRSLWGAKAEPPRPPVPWRESFRLNGGGILVNWGCYDLNYLFAILDWKLQPRTVLAHWWPVAAPMKDYVDAASDADAHYAAMVRCDDGAVLSLERGEYTATQSSKATQILGTKGTLHLPMEPSPERPDAVVLDRFVRGRGIVSETLWEGDLAARDTYPVIDFCEAIRGEHEIATGLERALFMQKLTDAIYRSAATGGCVDLEG